MLNISFSLIHLLILIILPQWKLKDLTLITTIQWLKGSLHFQFSFDLFFLFQNKTIMYILQADCFFEKTKFNISNTVFCFFYTGDNVITAQELFRNSPRKQLVYCLHLKDLTNKIISSIIGFIFYFDLSFGVTFIHVVL